MTGADAASTALATPLAIGGPPWILGHTGAPLEAPENTLASLRRAVELGLDGVEYDVRACASGEAVLLHDARLDRTTSASGPLREATLPELHGVDAGSWFGRAFAGEPLPLLDEALPLLGREPGAPPMHVVEMKEPDLLGEVERAVRNHPRLSVRVASARRDACVELRDRGLVPMLLVTRPDEDVRRFVRDERIAACAAPVRRWRALADGPAWDCERWGRAVDAPADLLDACRWPLFGFHTNEARRALAVRALCALAPGDGGAYPVDVPELRLEPQSELEPGRGEWAGRWHPRLRLRNPFPWPVRVAVELRVRRGAFEVTGLPVGAALRPKQELVHVFGLAGGSWRVGGDPCVAATFVWDAGAGRAAGALTLDAPLVRVRELVAPREARRVELLRERPDDAEATMTVRRGGPWLFVAAENPGELEEPSVVVHLDGQTHYGGRGLRLRLPAEFDRRAEGVPFSCGLLGMERGAWRARRWAGGVPGGLGSGAPGRLYPEARG